MNGSSRRYIVGMLVGGLLVVASAVPAAAGLKMFTAQLDPGQEVPPSTGSSGLGSALMTFDAKTGQLCYAISYSGLTGTEIATHFHGPAAPGEDADVVANVSPAPSALGSPKNDCVTLDKNAAKALKKGQVYLNVHTDFLTGGEIRGQVIPVKGKADPVNP